MDTNATPEKRTGRWHGMPYDWRRPTRARFGERWWNGDDPRVLVPKVWGVGWDVNLKALGCRLRRVGR